MKESIVAKTMRGFFILLPFLIAYLLLGQLVDLLLSLTQPIVDVMPGSLIRSEGMQRLFAFLVLIVLCILVAQVAHTTLARRFGRWFEDTVMGKFPPYALLKSLSQRLSGEEQERLQPALMTVAPDSRMLVAIVEELPDGDLTVFAPMAPAPGMGFLQIVSPTKLERLECSMSDALGWPLNWGVGTEALLAKKDPSPSGPSTADAPE